MERVMDNVALCFEPEREMMKAYLASDDKQIFLVRIRNGSKVYAPPAEQMIDQLPVDRPPGLGLGPQACVLSVLKLYNVLFNYNVNSLHYVPASRTDSEQTMTEASYAFGII